MKFPRILAAAAMGLVLPAFLSAAPGNKPEPEKKPAPEKKDAPPPRKQDGPPRKGPEAKPAPEKREMPPAGKPAGETRSFLGVATSPVPPSVREYLSLEEGFGITVHDVLPDSPAAAAGVKRNDIIVRFRDQMLISPEHLSLLVRREDAGAKIDLVLLRKGTEETVSVVLGEKEESFFRPSAGPLAPREWPNPPRNFGPGERDQWREWMQEQQDHWRKHWNQNAPTPPQPPGERAARPTDPATGKPPAVSVRPGFPVNVFGSKGVLKIDNQEGEVVIRVEEGQHKIEIRDAGGAMIHEGDYDPAAGTEALPKAARDHLEKMKLEDLEVLAPKLNPEKTSADCADCPETGAGIL